MLDCSRSRNTPGASLARVVSTGLAMSIQEQRRIVFGLASLKDALQAHMPDIALTTVPRGA